MGLDTDEFGVRIRCLQEIEKFINPIINDIHHEENISLSLDRVVEFPQPRTGQGRAAQERYEAGDAGPEQGQQGNGGAPESKAQFFDAEHCDSGYRAYHSAHSNSARESWYGACGIDPRTRQLLERNVMSGQDHQVCVTRARSSHHGHSCAGMRNVGR
ncbi:MAG: hypothetical protein ACYCT1_10835 [Steroidobacteraceae bacterium]